MAKSNSPGFGIMGLFGTVVRCDSTDESFYCNIMKLFNLLIVFVVVMVLIYNIYILLVEPIFSKRRRI